MEEKREPLSEMAIERKIQILRNKHMDSEVIALVKSDYEYGLTDDEIGLYLNKSYDIEQMKVLSKCLHKGVSEELLTLLKDSRMAAPKMQTALDYYEKGVPIDAIREVVQKDDTAVNMRRMFDVVLEKLNKAKEQMPQDLEYVKSLVAQMDEVVEKINHQNERYDALNKKLSEIETSKDDEEVRERLVKENQDKDALINSQQNELNKASSTIARLRDDIEKKDKEIKRMGDRIESLEDKIISVATENKKEAESKTYAYYLCATHKDSKQCSSHRISTDKLEEVVLELLQTHIDNMIDLKRILSFIGNVPFQQLDMKKLEERREKKQAEVDRCADLRGMLYEDMKDGIISKEDYKELHAAYEQRKKNAEIAIHQIELEMDDVLNRKSKGFVWLDYFTEHKNIEKLTRENKIGIVK